MRMTRELFEQYVLEAWEKLPPRFRERLENVVVSVEDAADRETLHLAGLNHPAELLGFYHGIPLTARTTAYGLVAPDKISIYRLPILAQCVNRGQARRLIRRVLWHEIAHHFGIDDDRLEELGAY